MFGIQKALHIVIERGLIRPTQGNLSIFILLVLINSFNLSPAGGTGKITTQNSLDG